MSAATSSEPGRKFFEAQDRLRGGLTPIYRRTRLKDLEEFVGVSPVYWIQLRIQGQGSRLAEKLIEERLKELGYRCEEWVGVEGSTAQLAIFSRIENGMSKMVIYVDETRSMRKCDLLIPISEGPLLPDFSSPHRKS